MSTEWMAFDPTELEGFAGGGVAILGAVERYYEQHVETAPPWPTPTPPMSAFVDAAGAHADFYANGRYAIFMPDLGSGVENATIDYFDAASAVGVILIVPEGRNPIITSPSGDGLLD